MFVLVIVVFNFGVDVDGLGELCELYCDVLEWFEVVLVVDKEELCCKCE